MRILHLSSLYPPHIVGGAERSVGLLAEAQLAQGHAVAAACLTPGEAERSVRHGVEVFRMPHGNDFWMEDWPQHAQRAREWAKFKQQANFGVERRFGEVIDAFRPDIVNTHSLVDVSTRVWRAAARRGVPIVHTLRDYDLLCAASSMFREDGPCTHRHLKCRVLTFTKAFDQKVVAAVTAVGRDVLRTHLEEGFFAHTPEPLRRVIWNGADVAGVEDGYVRPARTGPFTFGYLGRISPEKGVDVLLDACRLLPDTGWRLLVAGAAQGPMAVVERRAAGMPVTFLGFSEPKALLEACDVLVVPSLWAEPLGRTVIEAYRMGVPVIGSDAGGVAELIADPAWLFPPGDVPALGARLSAALNAGRDALPGAERFARVVRETRSPLVADRFLELYRDVLQ